MRENKIDRILYYFCILFGIIRQKIYVVYPNGELKRIYLKNIPTIIHDRNKNKDYAVVSVVSDTVNKSMIYYYIKVEELFNSLK